MKDDAMIGIESRCRAPVGVHSPIAVGGTRPSKAGLGMGRGGGEERDGQDKAEGVAEGSSFHAGEGIRG